MLTLETMQLWDHPRSCGEHHLASFLCKRRPWIIPARAGSTLGAQWARAQPEDHPRSCGEHGCAVPGNAVRSGSSPLVRGALHFCDKSPIRGRIIPARAGSTTWDAYVHAFDKDHPRSCGEHCISATNPPYAAGSSPLVRAAPHGTHTSTPSTRIIPARAGSTHRHDLVDVEARDHPRSCGEHQDAMPDASAFSGIIPARAGSTGWWRTCCKPSGDHPRSCGEHG